MSEFKPPQYKNRALHDWLEMASEGRIALPNFQRSYVWSNDRKEAYLEALFQKRPTGMIMILECNEDPQFESRNFHGTDIKLDERPELILDGQQRITSLWHMLIGSEESDANFYIEVEYLSLEDPNFSVEKVIHFTSKSRQGRIHDENPKYAFENNRIPVKVLWEGEDDWLLREWCTKVCDDNTKDAQQNAKDAHQLETHLKKNLRNPLLREQLYYCELPDTTTRDGAVDIFVNTNTSSAHITEFDIMVARAEGWHEEDLRERIEEYYVKSEHAKYYFDQDEEKYIPDIGTELLKVECLNIDKPPKRANYKEALQSIFGGEKKGRNDRFTQLSKNFDKALFLAAQHGGATRKTLPSWPPVYVIAALQDRIATIRKPDVISTVDNLLSAYLWHSFLSNRHESHVNDRLYEDFIDLSECIDYIVDDYYLNDVMPRIFDEEDYPLLSEKEIGSLERPLPWIGGSSRTARGLAAFIMASSPIPKDWATGKPLNLNRIRELEFSAKLDRHHIFPKSILAKAYDPQKEKDIINHGLNGVLISKESNIAMSNKNPSEYLQDRLRNNRSLSKKQLRDQVESHYVSYDILMEKGQIKRRYQKFIEDRAKWIGGLISDQSEETKEFFQGPEE